MHGLRQLLASPRPAISFVLLFTLLFASSFGDELGSIAATLGIGGVICAGVVLFVVVVFGRGAGAVFLLGVTVCLAFLFCTLTFMLSDAVADFFGWNLAWTRVVMGIVALVILVVGLQVQVTFPLWLRARTVVEVPRAHAFAHAIPHVTTTYWKPHARRVEAIPGEATRFKQVFTVNHIPEGAYLMIELSDVVPNERFTMSSVQGGEGNLTESEVEVETWTFADHPMGTEVHTKTCLRKAKIWTYFIGVVVAPHIDQLRQFKAIIQDETDESFASGFNARE